jgi:hypothetical protein
MKKITYLELLNLIKENKQPKEIIYNKDKYIWQEYDYHLDFGTSLSETINYCTRSLAFVPIIEIIEEDKPIEKLEKIPTSAYHFGKGITYCNFTNEQNINVLYLKNKINEIIDVVNELNKEKESE